jgi:hypothetical protein
LESQLSCNFSISSRVSAVIKGGQGEAYVEILPAHKKNPEVGSKKVTYSPTIYVEQSDATSFDVDEEVSIPQRFDLIRNSTYTNYLHTS